MTRQARFWAFVTVGGSLGFGTISSGQTEKAPPPPPPPPAVQPPARPTGSPAVPGELERLVGRMADEVRGLDVAIGTDLKSTPRGRQLHEDARELGQALGEFRGSTRDPNSRARAVRDYSGIDGSWHHLLSRLGEPGSSTTAIDRAAQQVARTDVMIHQALGLNEYPAGYYGATRPLSGMGELQRLTHALVDRAEALAAVVRADVGGPGGLRLNEDAVNLASAADTYHDALNIDGKIDASLSNGFAGVAGLSDRFEADLSQVNATPRVRNAWQAYQSTEVLVRRALGLPNAPEDIAGTFLMETPGGGTPVTNLAEQLVEQVTAFLQVFSPTAGAVPEGAQLLADAQALQAAATDFRQDAARALASGQLAYEFRDVDAIWQRLARRTNRLARGRTGPNIQQVGRIGQTIAEIHRLLGVPGYAPALEFDPTVAPATRTN